MKKRFALILSVSIIVFMFSGCSAKNLLNHKEWAISNFSSAVYVGDMVYFLQDNDEQDSDGKFFHCYSLNSYNMKTEQNNELVALGDNNDEVYHYKRIDEYYLGCLNYLNGRLYYIYDNTVFEYDIENGNVKELFKDEYEYHPYPGANEPIVFLYVNEDYFICAGQYSVYKCNIDGSNKTKIFDSEEIVGTASDYYTANEGVINLTYRISRSVDDGTYYYPQVRNVKINTDTEEYELLSFDSNEYDCYYYGDFELHQIKKYDANLEIWHKGLKVGAFPDYSDNYVLGEYDNEFYYYNSDNYFIRKYDINGTNTDVYYTKDFAENMCMQKNGIIIWEEWSKNEIKFRIFDLNSESNKKN